MVLLEKLNTIHFHCRIELQLNSLEATFSWARLL